MSITLMTVENADWEVQGPKEPATVLTPFSDVYVWSFLKPKIKNYYSSFTIG